MNKNIAVELCNLLRVSMDEIFHIEGKGSDKFRITQTGLEVYSEGYGWHSCLYLSDLVFGRKKIIKIPYEPVVGDKYWTVACEGWDEVAIVTWEDSPLDYILKAQRLIWRTAEEAEREIPHIYEELTGKKWSDSV